MAWARTRALWLPYMQKNFKKEGGGEYVPSDLIKLSFDKDEEEKEAKPKTIKEVKEQLGSRFKR